MSKNADWMHVAIYFTSALWQKQISLLWWAIYCVPTSIQPWRLCGRLSRHTSAVRDDWNAGACSSLAFFATLCRIVFCVKEMCLRSWWRMTDYLVCHSFTYQLHMITSVLLLQAWELIFPLTYIRTWNVCFPVRFLLAGVKKVSRFAPGFTVGCRYTVGCRSLDGGHFLEQIRSFL